MKINEFVQELENSVLDVIRKIIIVIFIVVNIIGFPILILFFNIMSPYGKGNGIIIIVIVIDIIVGIIVFIINRKLKNL